MATVRVLLTLALAIAAVSARTVIASTGWNVRSTMRVPVSAKVVIITPIHYPKYPWMCHFLRSALDSGGAPKVAIVPIFPDDAALTEFEAAFGSSSLHSGYLIIDPNRSKRPIEYKKLMAIWTVFNDTNAEWVIAADAETALQPNVRAPETYVRAWEQQKTIVFANTSGPHFGGRQRAQDNMDMACDAMRLPRVDGLAHWTDAPIYSRSDFAEFMDILRGRTTNDFTDSSRAIAMPWDHVMYLCYKIQKQGWAQKFVDMPSEELACEDHAMHAPGHRFTWARGICPVETLLEFHLDREGKREKGLARLPSAASNREKHCFAGWEDRGSNVWAQIGSPEWGDGRLTHRNNVTVPKKGSAVPWQPSSEKRKSSRPGSASREYGSRHSSHRDKSANLVEKRAGRTASTREGTQL